MSIGLILSVFVCFLLLKRYCCKPEEITPEQAEQARRIQEEDFRRIGIITHNSPEQHQRVLPRDAQARVSSWLDNITHISRASPTNFMPNENELHVIPTLHRIHSNEGTLATNDTAMTDLSPSTIDPSNDQLDYHHGDDLSNVSTIFNNQQRAFNRIFLV
eukprot:339787_1